MCLEATASPFSGPSRVFHEPEPFVPTSAILRYASRSGMDHSTGAMEPMNILYRRRALPGDGGVRRLGAALFHLRPRGLGRLAKRLFRAGHAHAGVLLVLVYLLYLPRGCVVGLLRHHPAPRNAQPPRPVCGSPWKTRVGTRGREPGGWLDSPIVGASMLAA